MAFWESAYCKPDQTDLIQEGMKINYVSNRPRLANIQPPVEIIAVLDAVIGGGLLQFA
jgi:hypothetical protein